MRYSIGIDVGSTTVKAVAKAEGTDEIVWQDYRRHETRQAGTVHHFLTRMEHDLGIAHDNTRVLFTGSGGGALAKLVGGRFVQEVNAVSLAVEKLYPDVQSVIELGGQDAKILIFQDQPGTDVRKKIASMNDKCAGGTGAVLDKLSAKLNIPPSSSANSATKDSPSTASPASAAFSPRATSTASKSRVSPRAS
jgi:activator of 2-hydroxyglutaryl-CoA dehydratase